MAWSDPGDFTSGQILTAAQMDAVREAMFFGQATFTTEAARDAAIPATAISLQEGMRAYLTAPTVPAATGTNTYVPTGVTTLYNGTNWPCITPVGANTNAAGTTTSTSFTATLSGSPGTNPSVTLVTGTTALVRISGGLTSSLVAGTAFISVAVSGATTLAAADAVGVVYDIATSNYAIQAAWVGIIGGLTAGSNTFTLQYRVTSGTGTFQRRNLTVQAIA